MKTLDPRTLEKFRRWQKADGWERIGINFTQAQREKLIRAGLARKGLFGTIEEIEPAEARTPTGPAGFGNARLDQLSLFS